MAMPRITAIKASSVIVTASHCGAPRRRRIPISGWKLMTRMSARRTGAMMPANCFSAEHRNQ
jgi:hypothetical protein